MMSAEVVKRGIVKRIARSTVSQLLKEAKIEPHLSRYWLNHRGRGPALAPRAQQPQHLPAAGDPAIQ